MEFSFFRMLSVDSTGGKMNDHKKVGGRISGVVQEGYNLESVKHLTSLVDSSVNFI